MPRPITPLLAADCVIELEAHPGRVLLIERANPPFGLALPGGFVDVGESVEDAARREALEETSLTVTLVALLGIYSEPSRDPRGHTASVVYVARSSGEPIAADDAAAVRLVDPRDRNLALAFDHRLVLDDYLAWSGQCHAP